MLKCGAGLRQVARCCAGGLGALALGVELAAELGLEGWVALPAGDGIGIDVEGGCDGVDGVAGEEQTGGRELIGIEWAG